MSIGIKDCNNLALLKAGANMKAIFLLGIVGLTANISFTFQGVKNLSAHFT